jgi:YVTN family beta-propeller protein
MRAGKVLMRSEAGNWTSRIAAMGMACLTLAGCRPHDFPQFPANYREYAYVTNGASGTVSVFDVVNVRLDREISVGQNPVAVAASPTKNEIYVVNSGVMGGPGSVTVIDAEKNAVSATITVHRQPVSIDVDHDGKLAYVAAFGSNMISVIDLDARREILTIGVGEKPKAARISADGKTLVAANSGSDSATVVDATLQRVRATFGGCPGASDVVILPDSSKAFVSCAGGHQVMAIALAAQEQPGRPARQDKLEAMLDVGHAPEHLTLKPDGGETFVLNSLSNSVSEVYNTTDEVGATYLIGNGPANGAVTSDNSMLYVANAHSQFVTLYSIDDGKRAGSVHVGDEPSAMAFSKAGHLLFVVDTGTDDVAAIRTSTRSLLALMPAGRAPNAIAVKGFSVK